MGGVVTECRVCSVAVIPQSCEGCVLRLREDVARLRRERNEWRQAYAEEAERGTFRYQKDRFAAEVARFEHELGQTRFGRALLSFVRWYGGLRRGW